MIDLVEERIDRHAFPHRVELGPARDAVDVGLDRLARQGAELFPRPGPEHATFIDREGPLVERRTRRRAGGEHREIAGHVLAGRHAGRIDVCVPSPAAKSFRDEAHISLWKESTGEDPGGWG